MIANTSVEAYYWQMLPSNKEELTRLETALEAAGVAWWWMEYPSGAVFFSENKTKMLDRHKEDFFHYTAFTKLVHPDDYEPMMQSMIALMTGKADKYETIYRIKASNGEYKRFYDKGKIVGRKGEEIEIAGVVIDMDALELVKARIKS